MPISRSNPQEETGPHPADRSRAAFPHCDQRILHAPGECSYCDTYDDWQELRRLWGIAFTGHEPVEDEHSKQLPCPADYNRPPDSPSDHRQWGGNVARDESDLEPGQWRSYPPLRLNGEDEPPDPHAVGPDVPVPGSTDWWDRFRDRLRGTR